MPLAAACEEWREKRQVREQIPRALCVSTLAKERLESEAERAAWLQTADARLTSAANQVAELTPSATPPNR